MQRHEIKIGDWLERIGGDSDVPIGTVMQVTGFDSQGDPEFENHSGRKNNFCRSNFKPYNPSMVGSVGKLTETGDLNDMFFDPSKPFSQEITW